MKQLHPPQLHDGADLFRMADCHQLLLEIARCPVAEEILHSGNMSTSAPCYKIVTSKAGTPFQLPEPWSGQIDKAPILFISSNPSIDQKEKYPVHSWPSAQITDFFQHRFSSTAGWVKDGINAVSWDSRYKYVSFWAKTRARVCEILQKNKDEIEPGIDFALTEIVHCKSRREKIGVPEAQDFCAKLYLERILSISAAKVMIVYGEPAKNATSHRFKSVLMPHPDIPRCASFNDGSGTIGFTFLPHPNERGSKKSLHANIGEKGLLFLRSHLT